MPVESEQVRPTTQADIPELSRLFADVFGQSRDDAIWRWKYFAHPIGAWSFVFEAGGRIVAHGGATAVRFRAGGRDLLAIQLVDFMSSPSYPGGIGAGGPFARTTTAMFREILATTEVRFLYGFPGERHRLVGERLLGYRTAGPIGELSLRSRSGSDVRARPLRESDLNRFDPLPSSMHAVRDASYLRWRYLEHPTVRYELVEGREASWFRRAGAVAIVRRDDDGVRLMETGGSFAPHDLKQLVERLAAMDGEVSGWCSPTHPTTDLLRRAGFDLGFRDHSLAAAWFLDEPDPERRRYFENEPPPGNDIYISLGDYDVY